jgi:hypothetical protein
MNTTISRTAVRIAAGLVLALLAFGTLTLEPSPAAAQGAPSLCTDRDALLSQLAHRYGEVPVAIGVANGRLVELLTAKDGLTWTIILTSPQGAGFDGPGRLSPLPRSARQPISALASAPAQGRLRPPSPDRPAR